MKVLKFGGTSVGKPERMHRVAELIKSDEQKVVVLSALSGVTNALVEISEFLYQQDTEAALEAIESLKAHHEAFVDDLLKEESRKEQARKVINKHFNLINAFTAYPQFSEKDEKVILARGELLSTQFFSIYLLEQQIPNVLIPALDFMRIDETEEPDMKSIEANLEPQIDNNPGQYIFITQGYICRNAQNEIDNLKRGGSDYTASLIAAALRAQEIQIWTDIDGMHNNDPRIVKNTRPIEELSFDEAAELAYFGAKILHPASIRPAQQYNIPVRLLNTMQPQAKGTIISKISTGQVGQIKAIAAKDGITAIKIKSSRMLMAYGFLRKIFEIFEEFRTPIDMITTSEVAVSLTIDTNQHLEEIQNELQRFGTVEIDQDLTIICVVGNFLSEEKGISTLIFDALKDIPLRMISYGGSEHNISLLVLTKFKEEALKLLNKGLFNQE
ncbi:MAG: aspartate kinase [Bacteroidota bacterium]